MHSAAIAVLAWLPPFGAVGSASAAIEATATTVGAGMLLGGFVAGTAAQLARSGAAPDRIPEAGYVGGWIALGAFLADLLLTLILR